MSVHRPRLTPWVVLDLSDADRLLDRPLNQAAA
jgi:hypothetical protein